MTAAERSLCRCHFFKRPRTIGADAAASAARSAATNWARRVESIPSHSFVSRRIVRRDVAPTSFQAFRAAPAPLPERTRISLPAPAARAARSSSRLAKELGEAAGARPLRAGAFLRRTGDLRVLLEAGLRRAGAFRGRAAGAAEDSSIG